MTRRELLTQVGACAGYSAVFGMMQTLGLLPATANASRLDLGDATPKAVRILILGAGLAGLTACYELARAGYDCILLEARRRAGGRNWTLRRGERVDELRFDQVCDFTEGQYFNTGPARIPSQHTALLRYCKLFSIPLEIFVNSNRNAYYYDGYGTLRGPLESRRIHEDMAGHIAELLAKAVQRNALDDEVSETDRSKLMLLLRQFGALDHNYRYRGTSRAGYAELPGAGLASGRPHVALTRESLFSSGFLRATLFAERDFEMQNTMLQPVGGMDRIVDAFVERTRPSLRLGARVTAISNDDDKVQVTAEVENEQIQYTGDYCICTLPLPVLSDIPTNLAPRMISAIRAATYEPACKLAWESKRRFWEEDHQIYGGISWINREITQVWYPSYDYHGQRGVIIGAYNLGPSAVGFAARPPAERAAVAKESLSLIHPRAVDAIERPVSVAWHRMAYSQGGFAQWSDEQRAFVYPVLNVPNKRFYLCGEHLSFWNGWQEGAIVSAHAVVKAIHTRVMQN